MRSNKDMSFPRRSAQSAGEGKTRLYGAGLRRGPSADLTVLGARGEIGVCLRLADACHGPAYANLAANGLPVTTERRIGVRSELSALGAFQVGVKHETAR